MFFIRCFIVSLIIFVVFGTLVADDTYPQLPLGANAPAVVDAHFPSRMHDFVFKNWSVVPQQKIAAVLKTDLENVQKIAYSMGLPPDPVIPMNVKERGYITILRRNWHLLPYSQILELLDMTPDELAFSLREDDFLFVKLGNTKPKCEPLIYEEPTDEMQRKADAIRAYLEEDFGDELKKPGEQRFGFVDFLSKPPENAQIFPLGKSQLSPRYVYSYFALFGDPLMNPELDSFPEGFLARLAQVGVDGVWMHIVLHQLTPGGKDFPELGAGHEIRIRNLKKLVEKADKYGVKIYLYLNEPRSMPLSFFEKHPDVQGVKGGDFAAMCTSDTEKKTLRWLENSLSFLFAEVPELGGVFTITGSENLTYCGSHGGWKNCPRCANRTDAELIGELHTVIERAVHKSSPDAKVIAWDWGWRGHGLSPDIIETLPQNVMFMSVSEWALPIERGGVKSVIGEYSISAVGPGPRATEQWKTARQHGLKTVAKVQLNNTWEFSAVPYLPVLELTAKHCKNLSTAEVSGMMLGWSLGGYPSPNHEIAYRFAMNPAASTDEVLDALALERYGSQGKTFARNAWKKMSDAFEEYPYGNGLYTAPTQMGPANPFYLKPTGYKATMVGIPYDDSASWCGQYPPNVFVAQMEKIASGWNEGIAELEKAFQFVPESRKADAVLDLRCAKTGAVHFASVARQCRFIILRNELADANPAKAVEIRNEIKSLLLAEIEAAKELYEIARDDSRIGYEASNHYFYVPLDLVEKVINCRDILEKLDARAR